MWNFVCFQARGNNHQLIEGFADSPGWIPAQAAHLVPERKRLKVGDTFSLVLFQLYTPSLTKLYKRKQTNNYLYIIVENKFSSDIYLNVASDEETPFCKPPGTQFLIHSLKAHTYKITAVA